MALSLEWARPGELERARHGDTPALFAGRREIAHLEVPGLIDLRPRTRVTGPAGQGEALALL